LLDIDMPGMQGTEVAQRLREKRGSSILLVAISGAADMATLARLGVFDLVFQKPLKDEDRAQVEKHIDERIGR
jgi:CheY-like chemotaxis protein